MQAAGLDRAIIDIKAPPATYDGIRLIEARGAAVYVKGWQDQPIAWKGVGRKPIPRDWHRCGNRPGILGRSNRHASHPVNAMLNYAYSILEAEVRIAVLEAGLDTEIGLIEICRRGTWTARRLQAPAERCIKGSGCDSSRRLSCRSRSGHQAGQWRIRRRPGLGSSRLSLRIPLTYSGCRVQRLAHRRFACIVGDHEL
jgi:hypothetical protein